MCPFLNIFLSSQNTDTEPKLILKTDPTRIFRKHVYCVLSGQTTLISLTDLTRSSGSGGCRRKEASDAGQQVRQTLEVNAIYRVSASNFNTRRETRTDRQTDMWHFSFWPVLPTNKVGSAKALIF